MPVFFGKKSYRSFSFDSIILLITFQVPEEIMADIIEMNAETGHPLDKHASILYDAVWALALGILIRLILKSLTNQSAESTDGIQHSQCTPFITNYDCFPVLEEILSLIIQLIKHILIDFNIKLKMRNKWFQIAVMSC